MNWNEIKEKYPKGWELYRQNDKLYGTHNVNYNSHRIFYDFFDEQGIYLATDIHWVGKRNGIQFLIYGFDIRDEFDIEVQAKTRTEAEEQAFIRAFEILEGKL